MPRHSKNRRPPWGYPPQYMPPMLPMPMGGGMFPLPPPPPPLPLPLLAPPMMPFVPVGVAPAKPATATTPPTTTTTPTTAAPEPADSSLERACLPHFAAELETNAARSPSDIVIIDFDRSLLKTPAVNMDLMDKDSRHVLESRLGAGAGWWQSRVVLDAALELGRWDATLVEIARSAALNPAALLVVTTYRSSELEPQIRAALAAQGVPAVDHFACSTHSHSSHSHSSHYSHYTMGSKAKHQLLDVLLAHYNASIERVFVFDASSADRKAYDQAAFRLVKNGSFRAETFRIANFVTPSVFFAPLLERELFEKLLQESNAPVTASVVTTNWQHLIAGESRRTLVQYLSALPLGEDATTQVLCNDIAILAGKLPPELRPHVGEPGAVNEWRLGGYEAHGRTVYLYALPLAEAAPPLAEPYTAHGARFEGARLFKQTDVPYTAVSDGPQFSTVVYERRALRVHESKA